MNRLILIGNGFDLAHNLKTSYKDFILWYLINCFCSTNNNKGFEDEFFAITKHRDQICEEKNISVKSLVEKYFRENIIQLIDDKILSYEDLSFNNPFKVSLKSPFFKNILTKCINANWVDIENEFYTQLKIILHKHQSHRKNELIDLNNSLKFIISQLEIYLQEIKVTHIHPDYSEIFDSKVEDMDFVKKIGSRELELKNSLILNFNYTNTIENYFKSNDYLINPKYIKVNYIHGKIGDKKNPLIFGFGDELDEDYKKMELEKTKGFFNYIKSFWYFQTSNYHNLIRFIESEDFQVFILGHSCGLSDRTMLNMIFEHKNCQSIKIFYHQKISGENNHRELTEE
ncbi:MAG: AbiH family protein, partial [Pelobium sp.]